MIGLLTYLPTTAYIPQYFFMLAFLYVVFRDRTRFVHAFEEFRLQPSHPINWNFLLVVLIIFLSSLNRIIHWDAATDWADYFPYFVLLIPTYILAISFSREDAKVLGTLVAIESLVVIVEWLAGVSTFDHSLSGFRELNENELAYFQRPLGLSESSSVMATKIFITWLIIDFFGLKSRFWLVAKAVMLFGVIFTFNRSVILALGIYLFISQIAQFVSMRYKLENAIVGFVTITVGFIGLVWVAITKWQVVVGQLTRNKGTIELTGREYIWADFLEFIQGHLVYGNNSIKLWLDGYHAHNAYIELIATNGIFIALVYFALIYRNIRQNNWMYVIPILIFGMTQYAIFWGISLLDILFWVILFTIPTATNLASFSEPMKQSPE